MSLKKAYLIVILVLLVDQISKIYVKTHFRLGEAKEVFSWFYIQFIENDGMAWGAEIPGSYGKLILTLFRIVAVGGIGWWLWDAVKKKQSPYLIVSIALILAGAFGNIIDSVIYGLIFDHSMPNQVATFNTANHYGTFLHGKVVDMLYFPIIKDAHFPQWIPGIGGKEFSFFNAIFNVADAAISVAVGILIVFNKKAFPKGE
ncbi:lipoprotein signal peptidase [Flavobacterium rivuli WB 3.3-2 = DSM 21788]|uniref:Lipoprotein signal peptidase n=1 Tax=Flavobacterium rivuli WB 3.3-2 = DSM 21788 TaxID=1121895 RepID=A0A0A2M019_9FLAO|nr:lipoprotein signal peptidase [Flavobacterium rivuli]KGO84813.1 lipoprotein signal peptidase [Flavobacterium rivuli WB 3.3-2 = DSM 21788]